MPAVCNISSCSFYSRRSSTGCAAITNPAQIPTCETKMRALIARREHDSKQVVVATGGARK